jgi:hypothetical protein
MDEKNSFDRYRPHFTTDTLLLTRYATAELLKLYIHWKFFLIDLCILFWTLEFSSITDFFLTDVAYSVPSVAYLFSPFLILQRSMVIAN